VRHIKRLLLFAAEIIVLAVGTVLSVVLGILLESVTRADLGFWLGLVLTALGFFAVRRKSRPWKIQYGAAGWELSQAERKLYPTRARNKRIARRILIWVPSVIAAVVLVFFPEVSHLAHPRSRYLKHYRVPISWTYTVWVRPWEDSVVHALISNAGRGRLGISPFWGRWAFSYMVFANENLDAATLQSWHETNETRRAKSLQQQTRELRLGDLPLTCWQYIPIYPNRPGPLSLFGAGPVWEVNCETPAAGELNFSAWFAGRETDIPRFYEIIDSISYLD
jgi:hypothetical protein